MVGNVNSLASRQVHCASQIHWDAVNRRFMWRKTMQYLSSATAIADVEKTMQYLQSATEFRLWGRPPSMYLVPCEMLARDSITTIQCHSQGWPLLPLQLVVTNDPSTHAVKYLPPEEKCKCLFLSCLSQPNQLWMDKWIKGTVVVAECDCACFIVIVCYYRN